MKLNEELQNNITKKFLKKLGRPTSENMQEIYLDLLNKEYTTEINICGKYTIAEVIYNRNKYDHHFLGVSSKNPNDEEDIYHGVRVAVEDALGKIMIKFCIKELVEEGL